MPWLYGSPRLFEQREREAPRAVAENAVAARVPMSSGIATTRGCIWSLCHEAVDAITRIIVGERTAWSGSIASSQTIYINAPQLFGGDSREGGVQGYVN